MFCRRTIFSKEMCRTEKMDEEVPGANVVVLNTTTHHRKSAYRPVLLVLSGRVSNILEHFVF